MQWENETGRNRLITAMEGSNKSLALPVVLPYMDIYADDRIEREIRRRYARILDDAGVAEYRLDASCDVEVRKESFESVYSEIGIGLDWRQVHRGPSRVWYEDTIVKRTEDGVLAYSPSKDASMSFTRYGVYAEEGDTSPWDLLGLEPVSRQEILDRVEVKHHSEIARSGILDLPRAEAKMLKDRYLTYCTISTPYSHLDTYLGFAGTMRLLKEDPGFLHELMDRILLQQQQVLKAYADCGVDAVWIEETGCGSELISPSHYERHVALYERQVISWAKSSGLYTILYFCGNSAPIFDVLKTSGADAYALEEGRKGYQLDIADIAEAFKDECVLGNIDTIWDFLKASDDRLLDALSHQISEGRKARSFIISAGSPLPAETPPERVKRFVEAARKYGQAGYSR